MFLAKYNFISQFQTLKRNFQLEIQINYLWFFPDVLIYAILREATDTLSIKN